jgi:hypothetical protein
MEFPEAKDFFVRTWQVEDACEVASDDLLPKLGEKAPDCFRNLGTALSLLYRQATCAWGCPGGDHVIEGLVGRAVNSAQGAIRLSRLGYYDEALSLGRSVGEVDDMDGGVQEQRDAV